MVILLPAYDDAAYPYFTPALFWFLLVGPFHVYPLPWDGAQHTSVKQIPKYQGTNPAPTTVPTSLERDLLPRLNRGQICGFADARYH